MLTAACGNDSDELAASDDAPDVLESDEASTDSATETTDPSQFVESETLSGEMITLNDEQLIITQAGSFTLTGDSAASVVVSTDGDVQLVLDGVNIVSETGAANVVEQADNVVIDLADGSDNYLEDAATRSDAEIDGTIYSDTDLTISGTGSLEVRANYEDDERHRF